MSTHTDATTGALLRTPIIERALGAVADRLRRHTATIHAARGARAGALGAGIAWPADGAEGGLVVTNAHVARADALRVAFPDGGDPALAAGVPARVVARDPGRDLAVLRVDAPLAPAPIGDPATLRPGALVVAVGHPWGMTLAASVGVVHRVTGAMGRRAVATVQANLRLAPGNSGGPLADAAGRIVGINTLVVGGTLAVAVSVDEARALVAALAPHPRLGVALRPVRLVAVGDAGGTPALLVLETAHDGAAARHGVLSGDALVAADGRPLAAPDDLLAALRAAGPLGTVVLDLVRADRRLTVAVALGAAERRPAAA